VALEAAHKAEHEAAMVAAGEGPTDPAEEKMKRAIAVAEAAVRKRDLTTSTRLQRLRGRGDGGDEDAASRGGSTFGSGSPGRLSSVHAIDPDRVATASFGL